MAVGVNENDGITEFGIKNIYPNPATNILNIVYYSNEGAEISIVNLLGQEIKHIKGDSSKGIHTNAIDVSAINKGIYFVTIISSNHESDVMKVVIE